MSFDVAGDVFFFWIRYKLSHHAHFFLEIEYKYMRSNKNNKIPSKTLNNEANALILRTIYLQMKLVKYPEAVRLNHYKLSFKVFNIPTYRWMYSFQVPMLLTWLKSLNPTNIERCMDIQMDGKWRSRRALCCLRSVNCRQLKRETENVWWISETQKWINPNWLLYYSHMHVPSKKA